MHSSSPKETPPDSAGSRGKNAIQGGGHALVDWDALAPHIDHPTRRRIVDELEEARDSFSARELCERFEDRRLPLSRVAYHLVALVNGDVLEEVGQRVTPYGLMPVFYLRSAS